MTSGSTIKIYKMEQVNTPQQVGEGETIGLTKIQQTLARTIEMTLKKVQKQDNMLKLSREAAEIWRSTRQNEKLVSSIQKSIKKDFYTVLLTGTGTASGTGLQATLSAAWGAVAKFYED